MTVLCPVPLRRSLGYEMFVIFSYSLVGLNIYYSIAYKEKAIPALTKNLKLAKVMQPFGAQLLIISDINFCLTLTMTSVTD